MWSYRALSSSATFSNLLYVALAAVEPGGEKGADEVDGELGADHLRAQAEHVHVVVLDALVRGVDVVADRGADARELAGGDRGADARAADEDPALGVAALDRLAQLARLVRVVDPLGVRVGAEVDDPVAERLAISSSTRSRSFTPRWSNATATSIGR